MRQDRTDCAGSIIRKVWKMLRQKKLTEIGRVQILQSSNQRNELRPLKWATLRMGALRCK
jgi:hypothetical protein